MREGLLPGRGIANRSKGYGMSYASITEETSPQKRRQMPEVQAALKTAEGMNVVPSSLFLRPSSQNLWAWVVISSLSLTQGRCIFVAHVLSFVDESA